MAPVLLEVLGMLYPNESQLGKTRWLSANVVRVSDGRITGGSPRG